MKSSPPALVVLMATGPSLLEAQGGPPLMTDDPATPGPGVWELNVATAVEKVGSRATIGAPLLDINYGVGEQVQLKFKVPWVFVAEEGESLRSSLGNSQLGVKWRFLEQAEHGVDLSVYPQAEFNNPTSSAERGIVEDGTVLTFPFQLEKTVGPVSLNPEVGYLVTEGEDQWVYGLALGFEPMPGLELIGELHGEAESDFGNDQLIFQVGTRWTVRDGVTILLAAGRGLRHPREGDIEFLAFVGLQFLLGRDSEARTGQY